MTSNPTGAENAQVQDDADRKACQIVSHAQDLWTGVGKRISHSSYIILAEQVATALREAEKRGMMRAVGIVRECGGHSIDNYAADIAAEAIERAASPPATEAK